MLCATSPDGTSWSAPRELTANDARAIADVFPVLFHDHGGEQRLAWLAASPAGSEVVERAVSGNAEPAPLPALPGSGYSHHIVATPTPGVYLAAWVAGADPDQEVYVRVFSR